MKRHASGQVATVALFPFLAVLICTMGALIVLLVLLVQQAGLDAHRLALAAPAPADTARWQQELEDAQWRKTVLEQSRAEKTEELSATRARLAHLEEHTQRLKAEAEELLAQARAIDEGRKLRDEELAAARAELAQWQEHLAQAQRELDDKRRQLAEQSRSYALIPYQGPLGTRRRPIYVECTELGVILQPEGLLLRAEDFQGPLGPGNPLEVALRAVREHLERTAGPQAGQPYPLLVVRPGGVLAYAAARAAMKSWDDEFGYELVGDDVKLDFGPPDPALSRLLQQSVAEARRRQAALAAMMPRRYGREELPRTAGTNTPALPTSVVVRDTGGGLATGTPPAQADRTSIGNRDISPNDRSLPGGSSSPEPRTGTSADASGEPGNPGPSGSTGRRTPSAVPAQGTARQTPGAPGAVPGGAAGPSNVSRGEGGQPTDEDASSGGGLAPSRPPVASTTASAGSSAGEAASPGTVGSPGAEVHLRMEPPRAAATFSAARTRPGDDSGRAATGKRPNWALPTARPHAIGVTRPIPLVVQTDRLMLLPERGRSRPVQELVVQPDLTEEDVQRLVAAVQREVESWGLAVADGYWKPLLVAEVAPGAESQFVRLQSALQGSGLELVRKKR